MVTRRVELPPNILRLIASKINNRKTLASMAQTHKQMAANMKQRLANIRESIRQRMRKHRRSPTSRGVPRGAPPAKRRKM